MEAEDKASLAVQNESEVVFLALYFNHGFIGVPLVRVEIQRWNELNSDVLKHRGEASTPVADGGVGNLDIVRSERCCGRNFCLGRTCSRP